MLDWVTCVRTFIQVVDSNGFAKAARKLYTTPSAISKRIAWLEDELNTQLFRRTTRQLHLTEAGSALYARSIPLITEWDEIKQEVSSGTDEIRGTLHIGSPVVFGNLYVTNLVPGFLQENPNLDIDLTMTSCPASLLEEEIDIFICYKRFIRNVSNLHEAPIFEIEHKLFAAPSYLEKFGTPEKFSDLAQHNCMTSTAYNPNAIWRFKDEEIKLRGSFRSNNREALISAATAGLGIICTTQMIVCHELKNKALVPVLPEVIIDKNMLYAFHPKLKYIPKKTKVFLEYMQEHIREIHCNI